MAGVLGGAFDDFVPLHPRSQTALCNLSGQGWRMRLCVRLLHDQVWQKSDGDAGARARAHAQMHTRTCCLGAQGPTFGKE
eukprot:14294427-Alexandrium_andersonii.AAC.1